jgi:Asp-tRNA(Asn)/Glu-tRNA(Gln) amidotransferase A subunit family amidase
METKKKAGKTLGRREMVKQGAAATIGTAVVLTESETIKGETSSAKHLGLVGLAAEYDKYDATGLAELIAKRQITPLELLNAVRQRVEALNPKLNAFCHLFFDKAELQIKQGLPTGPFRGVPFALKDLGQYLAGTITSAGSRVWKDYVADFDSTLVARYKQAGLVIFGKTNSPELGLTTTTESALYGKTHNPWNLERTSGGSSGGSSASVAARILPMAHASDGGGSIRIPASCCGLFGLKPTRGRVPMGPTQFEGWNGCSHHHAVTVSVRDSAALLDATAGAELGSPFFSLPPSRPFLKEVGADPGKLRIALVIEPYGGTPLDAECRRAVTDAARLCESLGHKVEETKLPIDNAAMREAFLTLIVVSLARTLEDAAKTLGRAVTEKDVEPVTWAMMQQGRAANPVAYSRAIATAHQVGLTMAKFMQNYDVILSPTLAKPPVPLGVLSLSPVSMAAFTKEVTEFGPCTALYNVTGQPSMSIPLHWSNDGLPIGVMFSGRFGEDAMLFRLAGQLEKAKPWARRKPKL